MTDDLIQKEEYLKNLIVRKESCNSKIKRINKAIDKRFNGIIWKVEITHSVNGYVKVPDECIPFIEEALKQGLKLYSDELEEYNQKLSKIDIHL